VLGRSSEAEDAAQEAAVRAWQKRRACAAPERPEPWVRTIAQREALRLAARRRPEAPLEAVGEIGACDEDERLLHHVVRAAVAELPPEEREVLVGCYWHDLSGKELSRLLGLTEATVRVRLHRTRTRLRDRLDASLL
jgi:RNA polymerase sigma factor (sigma-70 family)